MNLDREPCHAVHAGKQQVMMSVSHFVVLVFLIYFTMQDSSPNSDESPCKANLRGTVEVTPPCALNVTNPRKTKGVDDCSRHYIYKKRRLNFNADTSGSNTVPPNDFPLPEESTTFPDLLCAEGNEIDPMNNYSQLPIIDTVSAPLSSEPNCSNVEEHESVHIPHEETVACETASACETTETNLSTDAAAHGVPLHDIAAMPFPDLLSFLDTCDDFDVDILSLIDAVDIQCNLDEEFDPACLFTSEVLGDTTSSNPENDLNRNSSKYLADFDDDDSSGDEESSIKNTLAEKVGSVLRVWTLTQFIPHCQVTALLTDLKNIPELKNLPATTPTLIKTRRGKVQVVDITDGGQYFHFGILRNLLAILKKVLKGGHIKLYLNIDGIGIFKSKGSELWPILCRIANIDSVSCQPHRVSSRLLLFQIQTKIPYISEIFCGRSRKLN